MQTSELTPEIRQGIDQTLKRIYSHRPADVEEARAAIEEAIHAGQVDADLCPTNIVSIVLFGDCAEEYLTVRELALEVLGNPRRIYTTSTSETLACALMFARADWLLNYSWAGAAERVGPEWVKAIVRIERDFKWMRPPIKLVADNKVSAPGAPRARAGLGNSRKLS